MWQLLKMHKIKNSLSWAKALLDVPLADNIYITLTDHICFALQRYEEGIPLKHSFLWDVKQFYPREFDVGLLAIDLIANQTGVQFLEDEAAFMALHFVNASQYTEVSLNKTFKTTKLIQEINQLVVTCLGVTPDAKSLAHYRFINHVRFFAQRLFSQTTYVVEEEDDTLSFIRIQYPAAYECVQQVAAFIKGEYGHHMGEEEMTYMMVHVVRLMKEMK